jgi:glycosyltransferase involved in cell wall biosynthesis
VQRLSLAKRVIFVGQLEEQELHACYQAATLFIHPTLYEGSSLVTLEAMTHALPVVATRVGGLPDKIEAGVSGWLVNPGDVAGLSEAVGNALLQPGRLVAMGRAGRAIVEQKFAWSAVIQQLLGLYDDLLTQG